MVSEETLSLWGKIKKAFNEPPTLYERVDRLGILGIWISAAGIWIPLFSQQSIDTQVKFSLLTLAIVILCYSWIAIRLAHKYGGLATLISGRKLEIDIALLDKQAIANELNTTKLGYSTISYSAHNIFHEARNLIMCFMNAFNTPGFDPSIHAHLDIELERFVSHALDNVKTICNSITGTQCAITIKAHSIDSNKDSIVTTYARDSLSARERNNIDRKLPRFLAKDNTAFLRIISKDYDNNLYVNDNLLQDKDYINKNTAWKSCYDACIVVPIRCLMQRNVGSFDYDVFGFLCADNFGGGFDNKLAREILSAIGDSLYSVFYIYGLVRNRTDGGERK